MALETLLRAQREAATYLKVGPEQLASLHRTTIHELGTISVCGVEGRAYRAHCGRDGLIARGGIRLWPYPTEKIEKAVVGELAVEMLAKLCLRGHGNTFRGGKGLISLDLSSLPTNLLAEARSAVIAQYAGLMCDARLAGPFLDGTAGDIGTNGFADVYARVYHQRHPNDPHWLATITGKSEEGSLPFRTVSTGYGGFEAQHFLLQELQERPNEVVTTAVQGFGNVGAWYSRFAAADPRIRIAAISDSGGMITTDGPEGFHITETMVREIGDNPHFSGDKITALAARLRAEGQQVSITENSEDILTFPTDHLVLAAMGNVITHDNVGKLEVRQAIIELANGPTDADAHQELLARDITIVPDIVANGGGVDCSITERAANIRGGSMPSDQEVREGLRASTHKLMSDVLEVAARMNTADLRAAAATLSLGRLIAANGETVHSEIADLVGVA